MAISKKTWSRLIDSHYSNALDTSVIFRKEVSVIKMAREVVRRRPKWRN